MQHTLETIYNRFSAGRQPDDKTDLRASKIYTLMQDSFGLWCHYHVPADEYANENGRYDEARSMRDKAVKDEWIKQNYPYTTKISGKENTVL